MATAAHKVFAVTELFEQILMSAWISMERLFVLQRVSQQFNAAIADSFYLQGKVRLRHLTEQGCHHLTDREVYETHRASYGLLTLLDYDYFFIGPYISHYLSRGITASGDDPAFWTYSLNVNTDMIDFAISTGTQMGWKGRRRIHGPESSLKLKVHVQPCNTRHRTTYVDIINLPPEDSTLGNLIEVLKQVAKRTRNEHLTLAYEACRQENELTVHDFTPEQPVRRVSLRHFAESKVLGLPELLEQIMLNMNVKQLFANQRVSREVRDTIAGSPAILQKMQLRQAALTSANQPTDKKLGVAVSMLGEFDIDIFSRKGVDFDPSEQQEKFTFKFETVVSRNSHWEPPTIKVWMESRKQSQGRPALHNDQAHSWRTVKLSPVAVPVTIAVTVKVKFGYDQVWDDTRYARYEEAFEFESGDGTLGDVAWVLKEIGERKWKDHKGRLRTSNLRRVVAGVKSNSVGRVFW